MAEDTTAVWVNWTSEGGSLYNAGVASADRIFAVDGVPVTTVDSLRAVIGRRRIGETVQLDVVQRTVRRTIPMKIVALPRYRVSTYEAAGREVTPAMRKFRQAWLGSRVSTQER